MASSEFERSSLASSLGMAMGVSIPGVNYSTGPRRIWPTGVALGDLNGDQKLDVIVANSDLFSSRPSLFFWGMGMARWGREAIRCRRR